MPLSILPSRRQFLASSVSAAALLSLPRLGLAEDSERKTIALLADTHIAADKQAILRETKMAENLAKVWAELVAARPVAALVHGDVALLDGQHGDYKSVADLLLPGGDIEVPLHFMLGNHDNRESFREVLKSFRASPLETHHVAVFDAGPANWIMLDSLDKVNVTPGKIGESQLAWLAKSLDEHPDKPTIISVHHNPVFPMGDSPAKHSGILDTQALFEILAPRKQVKCLFFGHTHDWSVKEKGGIHLVNLPPVAYVFTKGRPNGWVSAELSATGITLTLLALDRGHKQHAEKHELSWRS